LEWFFVQRLLVSTLCLVVSISLFVTVHAIAVHHVYTAPSQTENLFGQLSLAEKTKAIEMTDLDRRVMTAVKGVRDPLYAEAVQAELRKDPQLAQDEAKRKAAAQRIIQKHKAIREEVLQWWEVLLALLIGWGGYYAPVGTLWFQKRMRHMEMKHEVDQFHTVIAMLAEMDRMSVEQLLEWMERFATIFKAPIQHCLLHYEHGAEQALERLKEEVPFLPFVRTIEKLQLAVEKIPIKQAFDDLETEQVFIQEQRKQEYERMIDTKAGWGKMIGFAPMYALVFFYLVFPLVYVSLKQMSVYYEQIQKIS
jgi:FtsZ-binding cell division protein ZapB